MNLNDENKRLIDGYIDEVSVNLPKKMRGEIAIEIRSLIIDALEDRIEGDDVDEDALISILRELGSPVAMAGSYHPHNYVIGPQMYAPFWMTVRWTFILITIFYFLGFFLSVGQAPQSLASIGTTLWELLSGYWDSALTTFAIIFLVFILLERTIPQGDWVGQLKAWGAISQIPFLRGVFGRSNAGEWDPKALAATPKSERVKRGETIFEFVLIILVAILFNFFPHKVGAFGILNGEPWFLPMLSPVFSSYISWWNLYWLLALGLNFSTLWIGRWTRTTRWVELGLMIFSGVLVYWILTGPSILGLTPEFLTLNSTTPSAINLAKDTLLPVLSVVFRVFLILHLIGKCIQVAVKLFRLLGRPPVLTFTPNKGSS
jgi:hypothetical protein